MALSLDEVHDLIDSWEIDPDVDTDLQKIIQASEV